MSDAKFGSWSVAESPVSIEYSLVVIEEIRHAVAEGFQRLSRGGIEVGGVLYGAHDGQTVRIMAMRPIACEHARGPAFLLSDKDRVELHAQLKEDRQDTRLDGLVSVGWFLSHTRTDVRLSEFDQEIYSIFFPEPWQVTLVVRPVRGGTMRAGFFVREADGTVKSDQSRLEFNFPDRLPGVQVDRPAERTPRDRPPGSERRPFSFDRPEAAATVPAERREPPPAPAFVPSFADVPPLKESPLFEQSRFEPQLLPEAQPSRKWIWLVALAILALGGAIVGLRHLMLNAGADPLSLTVVEREGQLQIEWNHSAKSITGAKRGSIDIADGGEKRTIALTPRTLAAGKIFYVRKSGDVEVRMAVEDDDGRRLEEASRFLGLPPAAVDSDAASDLQKRRDELEAEVRKLRQQNDGQAARIQQLERTLRILETRLNIDQARGQQ